MPVARVADSVVFFALDENDLTGSALLWACRNMVKRTDKLIVTTTCRSSFLNNSSSHDPALAVKNEANLVRLRLKPLIESAALDAGLQGLEWLLIISHNPHRFIDDIIEQGKSLKPKQILLFLDESRYAAEMGNGTDGPTAAQYIVCRCTAPTMVLTKTYIRQFEDMDIWGCS
eukprot:jgi/Hompol1/2204/HPOL_002099-RA